jgi:hypothetical protein
LFTLRSAAAIALHCKTGFGDKTKRLGSVASGDSGDSPVDRSNRLRWLKLRPQCTEIIMDVQS